jgi:multiple sugar transport system substrate-binding protein
LIYGIPFSVDSLALYYNIDFFNTAGIGTPPANWNEFKEDVKQLTQIDSFGNITQAGAAMGTANNIDRAVDIQYLLMLQNGTEMTDDKNSRATFDAKAQTSDGDTFVPGLDALVFYSDYANPKKTIYTWNAGMNFSIDAFIQENVAMILNYSYQDEVIKSKAPRLNYGISEMPQIEGTSKEINYASYWSEVVSSTSPYQEEAWDFLSYLAKKENIQLYSELTGRPASRRDVIEEQLDDPVLKVFSKQALTARSWYQADSEANEGIFSNMIQSVALGEVEVEEALNDANKQVTAVMQAQGED